MDFNVEQAKSAIRWIIATFGGGVIGWATAKGWDISGLMSIFNTEALIGAVASGLVLLWGVIAKTKVGLVSAAASVPEVKKIEISPASHAQADVATASKIVQSTPPSVVASGRL